MKTQLVNALLTGPFKVPTMRALRAVNTRRFGLTGSVDYWERNYARGGTSGEGSYGRLADFKARILNDFVAQHGVRSVIEFGCGDGNQLSLASYPGYVGVDVSASAVERCRRRFAADRTKTFLHIPPVGPVELPTAELAISLDVIFHLLEDDIYHEYMTRLCDAGERFVVIYSSDKDELPEWAEVRHRNFTRWIAQNRRDLTLIKKVDNPYPFDRVVAWTSFADFYLFAKA